MIYVFIRIIKFSFGGICQALFSINCMIFLDKKDNIYDKLRNFKLLPQCRNYIVERAYPCLIVKRQGC